MLTATCTNVGEKAMQKRARDFLIGLFFSLLILQQAYLRFWLFQHFCSETIQGLFYGYDLIVNLLCMGQLKYRYLLTVYNSEAFQ